MRTPYMAEQEARRREANLHRGAPAMARDHERNIPEVRRDDADQFRRDPDTPRDPLPIGVAIPMAEREEILVRRGYVKGPTFRSGSFSGGVIEEYNDLRRRVGCYVWVPDVGRVAFGFGSFCDVSKEGLRRELGLSEFV